MGGAACLVVPRESIMEMESHSMTESKCCRILAPDIAEAGLPVKEEVKEAYNDTEMTPSEPVDMMDVCNESDLVVRSEGQETEVVLDNIQLDSSGNSMPGEVSNTELLGRLENHVDILDNDDLKPCFEIQVKEIQSSAELESCTECNANEVMNSRELEHYAESLKNESGNGHCDKELPKKAPKESVLKEITNDIKLEHYDKELKDVTSDGEVKPCAENRKLEMLENCNSQLFTNEVKEVSGLGLEPFPKLKEVSNDDIHSEVSNPNVSPKHVTSTVTISSQAIDVLGIDHGACGEITSAYCQNSSSCGSLAKEDHKMETAGTSCVVLEIPKHISTTGVRKITFKFSKRKEDCSSNKSVAVKPTDDNMHEQYYENPVSMSSSYPVPGNGFHNHEGESYENADMNVGIDGSELYGAQSSLSFFGNRELKMSKKIVPDNYPNNVKKLLSTKILEGARVKYKSISGEKEITGIIKDCGYLCGCHACNFSKVVSAYEFERHAGTKTRHPNNHVYLENGKRIHSIIKELKTATISTLDEVIKGVAGSSVNEEYFQLWKANLQCGTGVSYASGVHQSQHSAVYPSSVSHRIQPNEDSLYPTSLHYSRSIPFDRQSYLEAPVQLKHLTKKPRHHFLSSVWEKKKGGEGGTKKRDNDLHKLLFMPNGLPDGTELAYYAKGKKVLGGYKQRNGIVCSCCNTEISPSQFEAHAGWSAKRQPYRHIYTSSGLALHEIAVMLANGQNIITSGHDDMCAVCGDGNELVLCSGCPRAFHAGCLGLQCHPTNDWHCPHCNDKFGPGRKASGESRPLIVRFTRVVKAPEFEPGGCVLCRSQEFSAANFDDKTVIICDQCEKEYHVGCLRESDMCDLKELPEDKWFCCDACNKIFAALQTLASGGPEVMPASASAALYNKHSVAGQIDRFESSEVNWRVLSGKSRSPDHLFLLSRAAEIFRECFDPIVAASGRDLIPVMVYGRNISGQEFSGMYCVVLTVRNIVVSAALLRIFGRDAAELPLVATGRENQGKGYFRALFACIERFLLSMDVKHLVLPAAEDAEPMWTKKLGFRKTSNEQMLKYTRDLQLTIFKGTSLLLKEVQQCSE